MATPVSLISSGEQAPLTRVLVANVPRNVACMVLPLIQKQPDMSCVGYVQGNVELLLATRRGVDVVILGAPRVEPPPGICSHLLSEFPTLKILVLVTPDSPGMLYWLGLRQLFVDQASGVEIIRTIRRCLSLNTTA